VSTKFPTLEQALNIEKAENEKFSSLKQDTFQALRSIPETWIFKLLDRNDSEKFHEYIEVVSEIIIENIKNIDDMPALEFMKNNILEILSENSKIVKQLKNDYRSVKNINISYEDFKRGLESSSDILSDVHLIVEKKKKEIVDNIKLKLEVLYSSCLSFKKMKESFEDYLKIYVNKSISAVNSELESFRRLRNIADNAKTEDIYNNAVIKYKKLEDHYRFLFYFGIGFLILVSISLFLVKFTLVPLFVSNIEFWVIKLSILAGGITLISYYLKQSIHYQRLADQNYQTQVELQAYPSFAESIPTEEAASVRKELALKYFGREIDGAAHKDMSNLIVDQMKSTTELVKASTEAIKNLKG